MRVRAAGARGRPCLPRKRLPLRSAFVAFADPMERIPYWVAFTTYFGYAYLIIVGFIRDIFSRKLAELVTGKSGRPGYAPLLADFEDFFQVRVCVRTELCARAHDRDAGGRAAAAVHADTRRVRPAGVQRPGPVHRRDDARLQAARSQHPAQRRRPGLCTLRIPVAHALTVSAPSFPVLRCGRVVAVRQRCLNLGSYNYLGFAQNGGADDTVFDTLEQFSVSTCSTIGSSHLSYPAPVRRPSARGEVRRQGSLRCRGRVQVSTCSSRSEMGTAPVHLELERTIAEFVGKVSAAQARTCPHQPAHNSPDTGNRVAATGRWRASAWLTGGALRSRRPSWSGWALRRTRA